MVKGADVEQAASASWGDEEIERGTVSSAA
jgi:hypothetical protein